MTTRLFLPNPTLAALVGATFVVGCPGGSEPSGDAGIVDAATDIGTDSGPTCIPTGTLDDPDANGDDTNCDGIDGDASAAIFVSSTGLDSSTPTSGTRPQPVRTISHALSLAASRGKTAVLVAAGSYVDHVDVASGIGVHGGYDGTTWQRSPTSQTVVLGASPVLAAVGIATTTRITRLTFESTDASTPSASAWAARFDDSDGIVLEDVVLRAGRGADGIDASAPSAPAADGGDGGPGTPGRFVTDVGASPYLEVLSGTTVVANLSTSVLIACTPNATGPLAPLYNCNPYTWSGPQAGGAAGTSPCSCANGGAGGSSLREPLGLADAFAPGTQRSARGMPGGSGDHMGASCNPGAPNAGGNEGSWGFQADTTTGRFLFAPTGASLSPGIGTDGADAPIAASGSGAPPASFDITGFVPSSGAPGEDGRAGGGGSGGGGGYGAVALDPAYSAWVTATGGAGGGGGAGGCGGAGGAAGTGGGASVGLILWNSNPTLVRVTIQSDQAGAGGDGAPGQAGGAGGDPGAGGIAGLHPNYLDHIVWAINLPEYGTTVAASAGASGGRGGRGADGGAGGGGAGGVSAAIVLGGDSTLGSMSTSVSLLPGTAGDPGNGGSPSLIGASGQSVVQLQLP